MIAESYHADPGSSGKEEINAFSHVKSCFALTDGGKILTQVITDQLSVSSDKHLASNVGGYAQSCNSEFLCKEVETFRKTVEFPSMIA